MTTSLAPGRVPRPTWSNELDAILAVSRAAAEGAAARNTLEQVAAAAVQLVGAGGAAIVLRAMDSETGLAVAGAFGMDQRYTDFLNGIEPLEVGKGLSGTAVARGAPVLVEDTRTDPLMAPWRTLLLEVGYRSVISIPLRPADGNVIGVLNVYRERPGPWRESDVRFLAVLADHAAIAIRISRLLEESHRQLEGLNLIVQSLRSQAHEHSNRLHTIHGLLWLGEYERAQRLIAEIEEGYHTSYGHVTSRIHNAVLAGFLLAEQAIAKQSGVQITIDRRSRLDELPRGISDFDAVTIVGNLVHNAEDAVSECSESRRRRISVAILQDAGELLVRVRDWGEGSSDEVLARMFARGVTGKQGHAGIGLALVREIVENAGGSVDARRAPRAGLVVTARLPR